MNQSILTEIGLTPGEEKVYLALAKLKVSTSGPISKQSGISHSKVYKILDKLEVKGLTGKIKKDNVTHFTSLNPNQILHYIEKKEEDLKEKKKEAQELINKLLTEKKDNTEASIRQGFKAVTNAFTDILDEHKKGETYKVLGGTYNDIPGLKEFFYKHHTRRAKKGIKLQMLINNSTKLESTTKKLATIKKLPKELDQLMEIVIYKTKVLIVLWTTIPLAFLIENDETNKAFSKYFNYLKKI